MELPDQPSAGARRALFDALRAVGVPELDAAAGRIPVDKIRDVHWTLAHEVALLRDYIERGGPPRAGRHRRE